MQNFHPNYFYTSLSGPTYRTQKEKGILNPRGTKGWIIVTLNPTKKTLEILYKFDLILFIYLFY